MNKELFFIGSIKAISFVLFFTVLYLLEQGLFSRNKSELKRGHFQRAISHLFIFIFNAAILMIIGRFAFQMANLKIEEVTIIKIVVGFMLLDYFMYWWHRLNHKVPILWKFHSVHHSDIKLDVTTALRFHIVELFIGLILKTLFAICFMIPLSVVLIHEVVLNISSLFHHSGIRINQRIESVLSKIIVTPYYHRAHHIDQKKYTNSHYSSVFTIWDLIHNSYHENFLKLSEDYNIGIGNGKNLEPKTYLKFLTILRFPFRRP